MAPWIKCLPRKRPDLSSNPWNLHKTRVWGGTISESNEMGGGGRKSLQELRPASLEYTAVDNKDPVSNSVYHDTRL